MFVFLRLLALVKSFGTLLVSPAEIMAAHKLAVYTSVGLKQKRADGFVSSSVSSSVLSKHSLYNFTVHPKVGVVVFFPNVLLIMS